jgi:hypothetical protein
VLLAPAPAPAPALPLLVGFVVSNAHGAACHRKVDALSANDVSVRDSLCTSSRDDIVLRHDPMSETRQTLRCACTRQNAASARLFHSVQERD